MKKQKPLELDGWMRSLAHPAEKAAVQVEFEDRTLCDLESIYIALQDIKDAKHYEWNPVSGSLIQRDGAPAYAVDLISAAMRQGKQDLIVRALNLSKKEQARFAMRRIVAWRKPNAKQLTKAELLVIMEKRFPELYPELPTSKRGMSLWWAEAGLDHLPQSRGYK